MKPQWNPNHPVINSEAEILKERPGGFSYPDRGGYTGFWVNINTSEVYGRFFVFGKLYKEVELPVGQGDSSNPYMVAILLFQKWKELMDEVTQKTKILHEAQNGVHVDQVMTYDLIARLSI
jgi:hypothetical protein